jgi:hypothetical protein
VASAPVGSILQTLWNKIRSVVNAKQDKLTAGSNITISGNTISASASGGIGASVANLSSQAATLGQAVRNGSATTAARSDHYHALPSADDVFLAAFSKFDEEQIPVRKTNSS